MRRFVAATVCALLWAGCGELMEPFPAQQNVTQAVFSNGTSDVTPPVLTVLDFSPATINTTAGADQVTVDFSVTDDLSGAVSAFAQFRSQSGSNTVGFGDGFPASVSHSGSLVLQFPQFSEAGTWILDFMSIRDAVGNEVVYNASQLAALGFPTQLTVQQTITVRIDITPGESPNVIRCRDRNNLLPVAILTTPDFDALSVDHATVVFGPGAAREAHIKAGLPARHIQDVDRDGDLDLLFHFSLADAFIACGATEAELNGRTFGGIPIRGVDAIISR